MPGINSRHWGRSTWLVLHTIGAKINDDDCAHLFCVVCLLRSNMPCSACREHFDAILAADGSRSKELVSKIVEGAEVPLTAKEVRTWLFELHNHVNVAVGRPWVVRPPNYALLAKDVPMRFDAHLYSMLSSLLLDHALHPELFVVERTKFFLRHLGQALACIDEDLAGLCVGLADDAGAKPGDAGAVYRRMLTTTLDHFLSVRKTTVWPLKQRLAEVRDVYAKAGLLK